MSNDDKVILDATKSWIARFVIGLDICPFAKHVPSTKIRYTIFGKDELLQILENIQMEFQYLLSHKSIETSLIVYPEASQDFNLFLDTYYACEQFMEDLGLDEEFQLVVFHPHFVFDESKADDPANFSNRSPYPMIHILRVASVSKAVASHPDIASIPESNMEKLRMRSYAYWEKFRMDSK